MGFVTGLFLHRAVVFLFSFGSMGDFRPDWHFKSNLTEELGFNPMNYLTGIGQYRESLKGTIL